MKFKELVLASVGFVLEYWEQLGKALLIPFLLSIFLELVTASMPLTVLSIILLFLQIFIQVLIAVTTHRMLLLGPQSVPTWGILRWSRRETRFACYVLGIGFFSSFIMFFVGFFASFNSGFIPSILVIVAFSIFVLVMTRLSLIFPAIAIDKKLSLGESWQLTKNWKKLMFFAVFLFPLVFVIPVLLINTIPFNMVISIVLTTCLTVFGVAALSISYKVISQNAEKTIYVGTLSD